MIINLHSWSLNEPKRVIEQIKSYPEANELLNKWNISIDMNPTTIEIYKIDAGNLVIRKANQFAIENIPNFDKKFQKGMLDQIPMRKLIVFCRQKDKEAGNTFIDALKKCVETLSYPMELPEVIYVNGDNFDIWKECFRKHLNPSIQAAILLLPGTKKSASQYYDNSKKFFLAECPIPSQVILTSTIENSKNLQATVHSLFIQLCTKIGATPWSFSDFPFVDQPIMVIGIDVVHGSCMGKDLLLSVCATINKHLSRYWSTSNTIDRIEKIGKGIQDAMKSCLLAFKDINGVFPTRIFVFRNGVSESQRKILEEIEVKAFLRSFEDMCIEHGMNIKPEFFFVCVNKKTNLKILFEDNLEKGLLNSPEKGTIMKDEKGNTRDFYLISQQDSPTYYFILSYRKTVEGNYVDLSENIPEEVMQKLQVLAYKLCFMYFNWSGAMKVPAPIQYARKLSHLIGNRLKPNNQTIVPHKVFEQYNSLYFI